MTGEEEIARAVGLLEGIGYDAGCYSRYLRELAGEILAPHLKIEAELRAEIERLRGAIEPFANAADKADKRCAEYEHLGMGKLSDNASFGLGIKLGDFRRARAALPGAAANG